MMAPAFLPATCCKNSTIVRRRIRSGKQSSSLNPTELGTIDQRERSRALDAAQINQRTRCGSTQPELRSADDAMGARERPK